MTQNQEANAVKATRIDQVLKTRKPDQILFEVRNRKIAELNNYKEAHTDKRYKDIQGLLTMMNAHGKLAKTDKHKIDGEEVSKMAN